MPFKTLVTMITMIRERCKKKRRKKITSVSFAFYTYIHSWKTNIFPFFPPSIHGKFWKVCKNAKTKTVHCPMLSVVGYRSPLWPRYQTIWFKTFILKDNCPFKLLLGKKEKNTYIHKTNMVCLFFLFFGTFPKRAAIICDSCEKNLLMIMLKGGKFWL